MMIYALFMAFMTLVGPQDVFAPAIHEFHLSKCDIDYSEEESALQISISIFIDDLEMTLKDQGYDNLKICTETEAPDAESLIFRYIQEHLVIEVDGRPVQLSWVGKEISEDLAAVWSYLQIDNVDPKESIAVTNDVLMASFDDQQNVVKLTMDKNRKSFFLFDRKEFAGTLNL